MERFYKKLKKETPSSPSVPSEAMLVTPSLDESTSPSPALPPDLRLHLSSRPIPRVSHSAQALIELDINSLESDPGLRINIMDYPPNKRDEVRRAYILRKACQPILKEFPQRKFGEELRRFNPSWYKMYPDWLEYSENKDAVFCLCCYLFKNETGKAAGGNAFVDGGFYGWNKVERCNKHVGTVNSAHNEASRKCVTLMNKKQSLTTIVDKQTTKEKRENQVRLSTSIDIMRFLLLQGLAVRGHDESEESTNRGNFLELLIWYAARKNDVDGVVLKNAPLNNKLTAPEIQRDIANAFAKETTKTILEDLGDECFSILVDESSDISHKEQVAICLRYVNRSGRVIERFLGLVHVTSTCASSLKTATFSKLLEHSLSPSRIRGQGYDGASNMKGEINGLKTLILKETSSAYYVHCFAHQLQLTLVAVSSKNEDCSWLFEQLANLLNVIASSCKRMEMLREKRLEEVAQALDIGELESGSGLNQELGLSRPGDTRWGSHYKILARVSTLFSSICSVLDTLGDTSLNVSDRTRAQTIMYQLQSFHFAFLAQLMMNIFGITNELNMSLQRKDQDIVNAMSLVALAKEKLQKMRDGGWESFLSRVCAFCAKHNIEIPQMDDDYAPWGRKKRRMEKVSYLHHFRVEVFLKVIDQQLQELNNRFDEAMAGLIEKELKTFDFPQKVVIFFSAHGVPLAYVEEAGDPYKAEMEECVDLIIEELEKRRITNACTLAYQSRVGPVEWLKPYTDDTIIDLGRKGVKRLLAVPPISFVSEHIETLEEIDVEYKELALKFGIEKWGRVPALGCEQTFISDLADAVIESLPYVGYGRVESRGSTVVGSARECGRAAGRLRFATKGAAGTGDVLGMGVDKERRNMEWKSRDACRSCVTCARSHHGKRVSSLVGSACVVPVSR